VLDDVHLAMRTGCGHSRPAREEVKMSKSIADPAGRVATGGIGAVLLAVVGIWRLGIEFENAWLRSLDAPPAPWEAAFDARRLQELRASGRAAGVTARAVQSREPVLA
jgi:hypothetical protein